MNRIAFHTTTQKTAVASFAFMLTLLVFAGVAFAQEQNITFPVAELGGCESKEQCKTYCDDPAHIAACVSFAEANGLMSSEEVARARTFSEEAGPGGCHGSECRALCEDPAYRDECIAFAREHGLMPSSSLQGSRLDLPAPGIHQEDKPNIDEDRAMRIVEEQGGPGGCRTKSECHAFCDIESNTETCLAFAAEHNLMPPEDIERARKMMTKGGPGGCRGMKCRAYCENPDHADECFAFAEEQGFIPPEEAERMRKFMDATGRDGCRGIECKRFCEDPAHQNECFEFAVQNGLISEEDATRARAFMQRGSPDEFGGPSEGFEEFVGPGGCRGHEECARYCGEHPDECRRFGPPSSVPQDFGQDRAMDMREFKAPPDMPCSTPEECRALYEERAGEFQHEYTPQESYPHEDPPPEESFPPHEFPSDYGQEFNAEYEEQYRIQNEEQYRNYQQYEGAGGEFKEFRPPEGYQPMGNEYQPPPNEPTSRLPASNFLAAVFFIIARLLGI